MGPGQIIKNQINLDLIKIIQFCLKIYDLLRHPHLWVGGWVDQWINGWVNGWVYGWDQVKSLKIKYIWTLEIIQFRWKIYDLLRHPHLWVAVWVVGWICGWVG